MTWAWAPFFGKLFLRVQANAGAKLVTINRFSKPPPGRNPVQLHSISVLGICLNVLVWGVLSFVALDGSLFLVLRCVRSHRRRQNRCVACGYNLTGNVSGVCSECGESI